MKAQTSGPFFGWLLDKHNLRYISSVGDGDNKSYTEVSKMAPYGAAVFIPKEDCIAHVPERMRTAIRKLTSTYKGEQIFDFFKQMQVIPKWYYIIILITT